MEKEFHGLKVGWNHSNWTITKVVQEDVIFQIGCMLTCI